MSLKEKLISSHILFQENYSAPEYIENIRDLAIEKFERTGFPKKGEEEWKYTNIEPLLKSDYTLNHFEDNNLEYKDIKNFFLHDIDSYKLVFVNGVYSSWLSDTTHDECDVCILSSVMNQSKYRDLLEKYFGKIASPSENMTLLNTAFIKEGAYISIPDHVILSKPIQIIYFTTSSHNVLNQHRNLVIIGKNAEAQIIERHQSLSNLSVLSNSVTEIAVEENAVLDFYKIQNDEINANLIDNTYIQQETRSTASVHTFSLGGNITRNNLNFYQKGSYSKSILKGISLIGKKQLVDQHTLVEHLSPYCESHELYKGVFDDQSKGVFNGKIKVYAEAQKINAFQQNNNILLSDRSSIDTKPQLEIFADDVRCSHGCTVGELDSDALFYLQSRGIPKKEAEALLLYGFASDILDSVRIPQIKARINKQIAAKLGVNLEFSV